MPFMIDAAVCSNMGRIRKNNEDNFYFNGLYMNESQRNTGGLLSRGSSEPVQIYAVCDGMGGEEGGEDASITAVRMLMQYIKTEQRPIGSGQIRELMQEISDKIEENAKKKGFRSGTTIAMIIICEDTVWFVHVGDSRVYCFEEGKLCRKTVDHSEVQRLFSMGLIRKEEMDTHPKRHAITQFLGMPRSDALVAPAVSEREPLAAGKRFLICSDGLTDMVKDPEISEILSKAANAEDAVKKLTTAALRHGGRDNVTSICLFVGSGKGGDRAVTVDRLKRRRILSVVGMAVGGIMMAVALLLLLL